MLKSINQSYIFLPHDTVKSDPAHYYSLADVQLIPTCLVMAETKNSLLGSITYFFLRPYQESCGTGQYACCHFPISVLACPTQNGRCMLDGLQLWKHELPIQSTMRSLRPDACLARLITACHFGLKLQLMNSVFLLHYTNVFVVIVIALFFIFTIITILIIFHLPLRHRQQACSVLNPTTKRSTNLVSSSRITRHGSW
jgi:hypothetical protein